MESCRACIQVVADLHYFYEEQDPHQSEKSNPDQSEKTDPDTHQSVSGPRHCS
jgi:hypothetical protein